jgi:hypothetical protein
MTDELCWMNDDRTEVKLALEVLCEHRSRREQRRVYGVVETEGTMTYLGEGTSVSELADGHSVPDLIVIATTA